MYCNHCAHREITEMNWCGMFIYHDDMDNEINWKIHAESEWSESVL